MTADAGRALDDGIRAAGEAIRRGLPISELISESLARASRSTPLRAYTELFHDQALLESGRRQAELDAGRDLGPLHGIPVAVKDNVDVAGSVTTAGSSFLRLEPAQDSTVVARLRAAGAIVVGKTNMHEFAWGGTTANPHTGVTRNPWDERRSPGGSSGGSGVAVALRTVSASIGTDTGGSIRSPAALNGVTGVRPTVGRVSNAGILPLAWSLDCTGPLAVTSEDAAIMLRGIAGPDSRDPVTTASVVPDYLADLDRPLAGLRLRWPDHYATKAVQSAVADSFSAALLTLQRAGAEVKPYTLEYVDELVDVLIVVNAAEASAVHATWLGAHAEHYSPEVRELLEAGHTFSAVDYIQAQRLRAHVRDALDRLFRSGVHAILTPTLPYTLPLIGQNEFDLGGELHDLHRSNMRFTAIASVAGLPAVSVPMAPDADDFPLGLQIVSGAFAEGTALRIAHLWQSVTDYHRHRPPGDSGG